MSNIKIRFAQPKDHDAILDIFNQAVRARANGFLTEETTESKAAWFEAFDANNCPLYVAELNDKVVGYCYLSPYRPGRQAMAKVAEISYYIDYNYHQLGIASALIEHTILDCNRLKKETLLAILLDTNLPSIAILEKYGFEKWGHYPNIIHMDDTVCGQLIYGLKTS